MQLAHVKNRETVVRMKESAQAKAKRQMSDSCKVQHNKPHVSVGIYWGPVLCQALCWHFIHTVSHLLKKWQGRLWPHFINTEAQRSEVTVAQRVHRKYLAPPTSPCIWILGLSRYISSPQNELLRQFNDPRSLTTININNRVILSWSWVNYGN